MLGEFEFIFFNLNPIGPVGFFLLFDKLQLPLFFFSFSGFLDFVEISFYFSFFFLQWQSAASAVVGTGIVTFRR